MTDELFTIADIKKHLREEVSEAGGAKKWLRKHKLSGMDHILRMVENGDAATLPQFLIVMGFRRVDRYVAVGGER